MSSLAELIVPWTDACRTDSVAYIAYLACVNNGIKLISSRDGDESRFDSGCERGCGHNDFCVEFARYKRIVEGKIALEDRRAIECVVVDSKGDGNRGVGKVELGDCGGRVPIDCVGDGMCGANDSGVGENIFNLDSGVSDSKVDGGTIPEVLNERGPRTLQNREKRAAAKKRKEKRKAMGCDWRKDRAKNQTLKESEEMRRKAENELATEKARRSLVALNALSLDDQIRCNRVKMQAAVERKLVSIEKDHNKLVKTGNVPRSSMTEAEEAGYAQTISSSISPNSSASMAEFRAQQKALLDAQKRIAELEEQIGTDVLNVKDPYAKSLWTDNSENRRILDDIYYDGYGELPNYCDSGKMRIIPV